MSHSFIKTSLNGRFLLGGLSALALTLATAVMAQERRPEGERRQEGERRFEGERGREGGMARMNPIFAALDTNGDGVIDEKELANAVVALKKLDKNGDGKITEDEVRPNFGPRGGPGGPGGRGGPVNVDEVVNRMLQMDKNGDGKLSKDELPERMAGMMERGDTNKDGFLSRDELVALAREQAQRGGPGGERGRDRGRENE